MRVKRQLKRCVIAAGLAASGVVAGFGLMAAARGRGAIFTLHHVRPKVAAAFAPNAHLDITPDFLDTAILTLKRTGYRFVALDALPALLSEPQGPPLAAFTLDDGYRDNLEHAAPVFRRHGVPYTVFVTKGFVERSHGAWWQTLDRLLSGIDHLAFDFGSGPERLELATSRGKQAAFDRLAAFVHGIDEAEAVARIDAAARQHGIDPLALIGALTLDVEGLARLAADPLASLGAHTVSHRALARLPRDEALAEIEGSIMTVEAITGRRPTTIAYPYGDRAAAGDREAALAEEAGLSVGVLTRPGTLRLQERLTGLPRISLNGYFQSAGAVAALASGIPFRLMGARD
ncbi:polysaccharide deacetylase family protein [Ensifer soli]|uniref:polysaccharide deacetylase family protein n=1 Tax=Ciceribacter sp. sgz301302 TaxID=3342379 RepID=UPI0035BB8F7D